jgi:hypothetical protein
MRSRKTVDKDHITARYSHPDVEWTTTSDSSPEKLLSAPGISVENNTWTALVPESYQLLRLCAEAWLKRCTNADQHTGFPRPAPATTRLQRPKRAMAEISALGFSSTTGALSDGTILAHMIWTGLNLQAPRQNIARAQRESIDSKAQSKAVQAELLLMYRAEHSGGQHCGVWGF